MPCRRDHPRVCGEKFRAYAMIWQEWGSPPRMRGKVKRQQATAPPGQDHPRICGEKNSTIHSYLNSTGSPPHMRGKGRDGRLHPALLGITPAYAGKSPARPGPRPWRWDHPRICGEKFPNIHVPVCRSGSSPHMRGKDCGVADMVLPVRITPAYAGKSFEHTR